MILIRNVSCDIVAGSKCLRWGLLLIPRHTYHIRRYTSVFPIETVRQDLRIGCFKEEP